MFMQYASALIVAIFTQVIQGICVYNMAFSCKLCVPHTTRVYCRLAFTRIADSLWIHQAECYAGNFWEINYVYICYTDFYLRCRLAAARFRGLLACTRNVESCFQYTNKYICRLYKSALYR